jgi:hypothetical protein
MLSFEKVMNNQYSIGCSANLNILLILSKIPVC